MDATLRKSRGKSQKRAKARTKKWGEEKGGVYTAVRRKKLKKEKKNFRGAGLPTGLRRPNEG